MVNHDSKRKKKTNTQIKSFWLLCVEGMNANFHSYFQRLIAQVTMWKLTLRKEKTGRGGWKRPPDDGCLAIFIMHTYLVSPLVNDWHVDVINKDRHLLSGWRSVSRTHTFINVALDCTLKREQKNKTIKYFVFSSPCSALKNVLDFIENLKSFCTKLGC